MSRLSSGLAMLHGRSLLRRPGTLSLRRLVDGQRLLRRLSRAERLRIHALIRIIAHASLPALLFLTINDAVETAMHRLHRSDWPHAHLLGS